MTIDPQTPRLLRRRAKEPDVPDRSEPEPTVSWAAKLDSFSPAPTSPGGVQAPKPAATEPELAAPAAAPAPAPAADPGSASSGGLTIQSTLDVLMTITGANCAALVDSASGMILGQSGSGINMDIAAAGATEAVRANLATLTALELPDAIDDLIITLTTQHHIIRPLTRNPEVFLYLILDKSTSNLALARYKVVESDANLAL